ncbi:hypothetical protein SCP_1502230 [Sparassis crispa]|uniref:Uncharacterized protein n=1 Tax=Sparassis crispa TaxID=139825 RepID=A0A401H446_9APHY|nr:hypothetical protein SCP_1502230 [Sparassis crispa]GBE89215.1 hypothetical protein SCP_1502230 [Sparassis crispa]
MLKASSRFEPYPLITDYYIAQARHRAKRKAYIDQVRIAKVFKGAMLIKLRLQLEQTVTKLQTVLALSPDQVAALPPPLLRIRELEQENELLHRELDELRQQVELRNAQLRPDVNRREHFAASDDRLSERDLRRRRTVESGDIYLVGPVAYISCAQPTIYLRSIPMSLIHIVHRLRW